MHLHVRSPRVLVACLIAAAFAIVTPCVVPVATAPVDLPGILNDTASHAPPSTGTYAYNTFVPDNTPGATYIDPVFGTTVRRLTTDHLSDDLHGRNMYWNADGTKYVHRGQVIDTATGLVTHTVPTGTFAADAGFDPVDPNVYYYVSNLTEIHRVALSTTSAAISDTVFFTAPSAIEPLGGTLNWWDASGRYFIVRYGEEPSVHVFDRLDLAAGPYAGGADGSVTIDAGAYVGISPSGNHLVGYDDVLSRGVSWQIDHASRTVQSANYFWSLCGDRGAFMSTSDGRDYMVVANCNDAAEVWRVDITNNAVGLTAGQQKALSNNQRLIAWPTAGDAVHFTAAVRGPFRDWAFLSTADTTDQFNTGSDAGGVIAPWRAYKQEIIAVNVMTGDVRRIAHHRSRSPELNPANEPRISASWAGEVVGWASDFNTPDSTDIFAAAFAVTPPIITDVMPMDVTGTTAGIFWTTDQLATSQVEFGLTTAYGSTTTLDSTQTSSHLQTLTGLTFGTTYHFHVLSTNVRGLTATSPDATFTTATPPIISSVTATSITGTSATVRWLTAQPADSQVEYGLTTSYGASTPVDPESTFAHVVPLTGLAINTTYHYRVRSANAAGLSTVSPDFAFTTAAYPIVSNVSVSDITGATATVSWHTDQPSTSVVEYGPTSAYGTTKADRLSTLIFEENFTSDNSRNGLTAPTQTEMFDRGWRDGVNDIGTGYKFEIDPTLNKPVIFAHWSTLTAGDSDPKGPDGGASALKRIFPGTQDATMYALVKFHNVENSPAGAHWIRFFNDPSFDANSPGNADGQMDLDVSGSLNCGAPPCEGQLNWLLDPTTKQVVENPHGSQHNGFLLYAGDEFSYATPDKNNVWRDDVWYEVVWYVKASTSGTSPTDTSDGQMRVYLRPIGTTAWTTVFDGANFVNSELTSRISAWMIGPYMDRWTTDIRHYFSRVVLWSGDAYSDGTLGAFLEAPPAETDPPASTGAPALVTTHSIVLTGLTSTTPYHYRVRSMNAAGLETASPDATFTTTINVSNITVSNVQGTGAAIGWKTDQPADTQIEYGPTTAYGSLTPLAPALITGHLQSVNTGLQPGTTYFFRVRSRNANGVLGTGTGSFTTAPAAVISNVAVADVQATSATITWTTDLPSNTSIQYGPVSYSSTTPLDPTLVTSHSQTITGLTPGTSYFYLVRSVTAQSALSKLGGFTFTTLTPPVISNVSATHLTSGSATIQWTTNNRADSQIEYGLTSAYGSMTSVDPATVTAHAMPVTGLAPLTTYHYRVRSSNSAGATTSGDFTFTTTGALVISAVAVTQLTSSSARITWTTDQPADSQIEYGATTAYGSFNTLDAALVTSHSQTLTGLSPTTIYHFRVRSSNGVVAMSADGTIALPPIVSNVVVSNIQGAGAAIGWSTDQPADTQVEYGPTSAYGSLTPLSTPLIVNHLLSVNSGLQPGTTYFFRVLSRNAGGVLGTATGSFTTAPAAVISNVAVANVTGTTATITWTTDLPSNSCIQYGTVAYTSTSTLDPALVTSHSHTITGLTPGTTYVYLVRSITAQSALTKLGGFTVTTVALPIVTNISAGNIAGTSATITWTTDLPSDSQVEYGTTTAYGGSTAINPTPVTSHSVALGGLTPATTYHYRVRSANAAGTTTSGDRTFTANQPPPAISNVVASVTTSSATITWTTDLPSNSQVWYNTNGPGGGLPTPLDPSLVTAHSVTITGLATGTTYYFFVTSANAGGQTNSGNFTLLTTGPAPIIISIASTQKLLTSATITWVTNIASDSQVEYGLTSAYGNSTVVDPAPVQSHSVQLTGLTSNTTYHFRVRSVNNGAPVTSGDITFSTPAPITFSAISASGITATAATITWTTNVPSNSQVEYGTTTAYGNSTAVATGEATSHSMTLTDLTGGTTYHYRVRSANSVTSSTSADFTFATLGNPIISNIAGLVIAGGTTTVTWTTDQPSDSQIDYGVTSSYGSTTSLDPTLSMSHSQTITGLVAGSEYHYRVRSRNVGGLLTVSDDQVLLPAPPIISSVTTSGVTGTNATINWSTDVPASSQVEYGTSTAYGSLSSFDASATLTHSITLNGVFIPNTTYHFRVLSTNAGGARASSDFTFTTVPAPVVSNVAVSNIQGTGAAIGWSTDQPADTQVEYGLTTAYGSLTALSTPLILNHLQSVNSGLQPGTTYFFRVRSKNASGVVGTGTGSFTTAPATVISNVAVASVTDTTATITWTTDLPANSRIEYGTVSYTSGTTLDPALVTSHSHTITGLSPNTTYVYLVRSITAQNTLTKLGGFTVKTSATPVPIISNIVGPQIAGGTTTVAWTTDQATDSQVEYGLTSSYGSTTPLDSTLVTSHSQPITGLVAGSPYHYRVRSRNGAGVLAVSDDRVLLPAPPIISSVTTSGITGTSATVSWSTDAPSSSQVEYGTSTAYGAMSPFDGSATLTHAIALNGVLVPNTTYHFRVLSTNIGGLTASGDFTLTTPPPPPVVSNVVVSNIQGTGAAIGWTTDQPADTQIEYGPTTAYGSLTPLSTPLIVNHLQSVNSGLQPGTTYFFRVRSTNASGGAGTATGSFTTAPATVISNVLVANVTDTTATITWTTDLPSNTCIQYGTVSYSSTTTLDPALVTSHSQTITGLTPGTTYVFLVRSITGQNTLTKLGGFTFTTSR